LKYLLLYNPVSGKGKFHKKIPYIIKAFKKQNLLLDIYESKSEKDLTKKAYSEAKNYDVFLVAGGDGSVNEVLNGIMTSNFRPKLGIFPSGTANDTAAILGISRSLKKSLKIIFNNQSVKMDVNQVNDRFFIYTVAAGILTPISYDVDRALIKKYGYLAYLRAGLKDLKKDYQIDMEIEYDDGITSGKFMMLLGLSAKRVGGMNLRRFSRPKLNDGILEIRLFKYKKRSKLKRLIKFFLLQGLKSKLDIHLKSSHFKITTSEDVVWNLDGEKGFCGNVEIRVLKENLEVFVSKKTIKKYF